MFGPVGIRLDLVRSQPNPFGTKAAGMRHRVANFFGPRFQVQIHFLNLAILGSGVHQTQAFSQRWCYEQLPDTTVIVVPNIWPKDPFWASRVMVQVESRRSDTPRLRDCTVGPFAIQVEVLKWPAPTHSCIAKPTHSCWLCWIFHCHFARIFSLCPKPVAIEVASFGQVGKVPFHSNVDQVVPLPFVLEALLQNQQIINQGFKESLVVLLSRGAFQKETAWRKQPATKNWLRLKVFQLTYIEVYAKTKFIETCGQESGLQL